MENLKGTRTNLCDDFDFTDGWGLLCHRNSAEWWDLRGVKKINVTISKRRTVSSYKCTIDLYTGDLRIQAEDTGKWFGYSIYTTLRIAIERVVNPGQTFYLGVEIVD